MTDYVHDSYHDPFAGRYAGFWIKFVAPIIDIILLLPFYYALQALWGNEKLLVQELILTLIAVIAYSVFFASKWQATPGMRLLGFYVCDTEGKALSYKRSFSWIMISTLGLAICCIGLIYMQLQFDLVAMLQLQVSCQQENMLLEDCAVEIENAIGIPFQTYSLMILGSVSLALFLMLIWALSVALAKDKTGFHNLVCGTRFLKGRI